MSFQTFVTDLPQVVCKPGDGLWPPKFDKMWPSDNILLKNHLLMLSSFFQHDEESCCFMLVLLEEVLSFPLKTRAQAKTCLHREIIMCRAHVDL